MQREYYHLRKYEMLEFLNANYLPARLYCGGTLHANKSNGIVRPYTKTVNKVARYQNAGSAKT